jgi:hypothetical protein
MSAHRRTWGLLAVTLAITVAVAAVIVVSSGAPARREAGPSVRPSPAETAPPEQPVRTPERPAAWPLAVLPRRLHGRTIRIDGRRILLDRATLTCGGIGPAVDRTGGARSWTRFRCVQPTFPRGSVVGPDAVFFVEPHAGEAYAVRDGRMSSY